MTAIRMCVAYDGTDFAGFQSQPSQRTVQGELEAALGKLARSTVRVRGAGRTDAGVHALGQVVTLETHADPGALHPDVILRAMPALLPKDVAIVDAQTAPEGFDARMSAKSREYAYLLWCGDAPHPLYSKYAVWPQTSIDSCRMSLALQSIVGTHDFSSFARVRDEQSPVRTVIEARAVADGPFVRVRVIGESFLHQMVRSIVGTALEIGTERKPVSWMKDVLDARDRSAAGPVAPAQGLTLVDVAYEGIEWPRRQAVTWPWSDAHHLREQRGIA
jgi:tRNA pseudouridine38-40 synthase